MRTKRCENCKILFVKRTAKKFCGKACFYAWSKGRRFSPQSEFKSGHISWLKGSKGLIGINKGSFEKGHRAWNRGQPLSNDSRLKLSISLKGRNAWNKGLEWVEQRGK